MSSTRRDLLLTAAACFVVTPATGTAMTSPTAKEIEQRLVKLADAYQDRLSSTPYGSLSRPEQVFGGVWELEAEVNNGGFSQYFLNSSGRYAPLAPDALQAIGAPHSAEIAQAALAVMGPRVHWTDDDNRQEVVEHMGARAEAALDVVDTKFYACPEDLSALLYRYVAEHRTAFALPVGF